MFTVDQVGCLIDGHHGWHAAYMIVDLAVDHGMALSEVDQEALGVYRAGSDDTLSTGDHPSDYMLNQGGLVDHAEAWLNDHAVPDGYMIEWVDGELFLSKIDDLDTLTEDTRWASRSAEQRGEV